MLIEQLKLRNFLSFGPNSSTLELGRLNVVIGPNGSGKSNFIEAINLLRATPKNLSNPIDEIGGVGEWIWKGGEGGSKISIEALVKNVQESSREMPLYYHIEIGELGQRPFVFDERIATPDLPQEDAELYFHFDQPHGRAIINVREDEYTRNETIADQLDREQSILSQRRDPDRLPELTYLADAFARIRIYQDWSFGRYASMRSPQRPNLRSKHVEEDASNLGLVLNDFRRNPSAKNKLLARLQKLYEGITDFGVDIAGNSLRVFLEEENIAVPATRLSDGTLRYLYLLAILCRPENSTLICIEEPELGLHPDILPSLAEVLRDASEHTQIIVTTHSDRLVDEFTDIPESVLVTEKHDGQTVIKRLNKEDLDDWLKEYSLGELWSRGELGGNRW